MIYLRHMQKPRRLGYPRMNIVFTCLYVCQHARISEAACKSLFLDLGNWHENVNFGEVNSWYQNCHLWSGNVLNDLEFDYYCDEFDSILWCIHRQFIFHPIARTQLDPVQLSIVCVEKGLNLCPIDVKRPQ